MALCFCSSYWELIEIIPMPFNPKSCWLPFAQAPPSTQVFGSQRVQGTGSQGHTSAPCSREKDSARVQQYMALLPCMQMALWDRPKPRNPMALFPQSYEAVTVLWTRQTWSQMPSPNTQPSAAFVLLCLQVSQEIQLLCN